MDCADLRLVSFSKVSPTFHFSAPRAPYLPLRQRRTRFSGFTHLPNEPRTVAVLFDPSSGRELSVATDARGLQFYSGNYLEGVPARDGSRYRKHAGLCLEAGGFPDEINMDGERAVLRPGAVYRQRTRYTLRVR